MEINIEKLTEVRALLRISVRSIMDIEYLIKNYHYAYYDKKSEINFLDREAKNYIKPNDVNMEQFNELYFFIKGLGWRRLKRTKSEGISVDRKKFFGRGWDIRCSRTCLDLLLISGRYFWHFMFRCPAGKDEEIPISGTVAFRAFVRELEKDGVDLEDLAIDNGKEVKQTIPNAKIGLYSESVANRIYSKAHHIDFHSSHPAGMARYYPQLRPTIERIYEEKEKYDKDSWEYKIRKAIMNETWGMLQSKYKGYKWAHISRDGIQDTNDRIEELTARLIASGRTVLAWNTDGIWYTGDIYHGEGEGEGLGQWSNDHMNCRLRFKSRGCYEFEEDGKYHPVVRGYTGLDQLKPREEWNWGDIYISIPFAYKFDEEKGVYKTYDYDEIGL